jgi:hypothetical protein
MVLDWLTLVGLVAALVAELSWYCWQEWQSKQVAAQAALPPRFRALVAGGFRADQEYPCRAARVRHRLVKRDGGAGRMAD